MPFLAEESVPIPPKDILSWMFDETKLDPEKPVSSTIALLRCAYFVDVLLTCYASLRFTSMRSTRQGPSLTIKPGQLYASWLRAFKLLGLEKETVFVFTVSMM